MTDVVVVFLCISNTDGMQLKSERTTSQQFSNGGSGDHWDLQKDIKIHRRLQKHFDAVLFMKAVLQYMKILITVVKLQINERV